MLERRRERVREKVKFRKTTEELIVNLSGFTGSEDLAFPWLVVRGNSQC